MRKGFVLITGVSTGIGYDAVRYLMTHGYKVIGSVRKEKDRLRLTKDFGASFYPLVFDVTKVDEIQEAKKEVEKIIGTNKLSALVNNAGIAKGGPMELLSDEDFRWQMEVNLFAVRNVTNAFLPFLKGNHKDEIRGGKIIMISSISGYFNTPFNGAYCVSKHAMESLAEIYRRELYMYNIDVVSIQPGPIASKIWEKNIDACSVYEDSDYKMLCRKAEKVMQDGQKEALHPEVVSKRILKIIERKTKTAYVINRRLIPTLIFTKLIPRRWVDKIIYKNLFN